MRTRLGLYLITMRLLISVTSTTSHAREKGILGFLDAGGSFTIISVPGAIATWADGINDSGKIVGMVYVPEPATLLLVAAGLLRLVGCRRKFKGVNV